MIYKCVSSFVKQMTRRVPRRFPSSARRPAYLSLGLCHRTSTVRILHETADGGQVKNRLTQQNDRGSYHTFGSLVGRPYDLHCTAMHYLEKMAAVHNARICIDANHILCFCSTVAHMADFRSESYRSISGCSLRFPLLFLVPKKKHGNIF